MRHRRSHALYCLWSSDAPWGPLFQLYQGPNRVAAESPKKSCWYGTAMILAGGERGAGDEKQTVWLQPPTSPHPQPPPPAQDEATERHWSEWGLLMASSNEQFFFSPPVWASNSNIQCLQMEAGVGGSCWFSSFYVRQQPKWVPPRSWLVPAGAAEFYIKLQCAHTNTTTLLFSSANCFSVGGLAVGEEKCSCSCSLAVTEKHFVGSFTALWIHNADSNLEIVLCSGLSKA